MVNTAGRVDRLISISFLPEESRINSRHSVASLCWKQMPRADEQQLNQLGA